MTTLLEYLDHEFDETNAIVRRWMGDGMMFSGPGMRVFSGPVTRGTPGAKRPWWFTRTDCPVSSHLACCATVNRHGTEWVLINAYPCLTHAKEYWALVKDA